MTGLREALGRAHRAIADATHGAPDTETVGLMRELGNRLEAFSLFRCTTEMLAAGGRDSATLETLLRRARREGPYHSLFLTEGIGYLCAGTYRVAEQPAEAQPSLHVGMGLQFAERALRQTKGNRLDRVVSYYLRQWSIHALARWHCAGAEPFGFAAAILCPDLVQTLSHAADFDVERAGYYWHGVGRALYFAPTMAMPLCGAHARAMWQARTVGHSEHAVANVMAGWAWGMTLTNVRHPDLIEAALVHACEAAPSLEALRHGIAGALAMADAGAPSHPFRRALWHHQPRERHGASVWNRLVRSACQTPTTAMNLPSAFRYVGPGDGLSAR
jgi:hypothetical protein